MRKSILLLISAFTAAFVLPVNASAQVHLKGQLKGMGTRTVPMNYDGASSMLGDSRNIILHTDAEGCFDTIVALKEPAYFNISRNTLYLTPGDDLTVYITTNNKEASFKGKGAEANEYMKYRLFPHGGSYLEGGQNIKYDFNTTRSFIDSLATLRLDQLKSLPQVNDKFKSMEQARITADKLISFFYYPMYAKMMAQGRKNISFAVNNVDSFYTALNSDAQKAMKCILSDDANLDVAAVRSILGNVQEGRKSWMEGVELSHRAQELLKASDFVYKLRQHVSDSLLTETKAFAARMANKDLANELNDKTAQAEKLLKGPAIDFSFTDVEGKTHHLSDFKGKVIYIDFWATWCGPCVKESPYFDALSKKFSGKDIVFLPISTDTSRNAWLRYIEKKHKELTQYNTTDNKIKTGWAIFYIPRFVLIDKDFNIADAYAPKPSEAAAEKAINDLLK